jgi:hypothetical protein
LGCLEPRFCPRRPDHPVRGERRGLPLERDRREALRLEIVSDPIVRLGAYPQFIRRRFGGEPRTEVDGIAGDPVGAVAPISQAGHNEPGVDAAMQPKRLADARLDLRRHVSHHSVQCHRRTHRAHRIVLMGGRDAEQG